MSLVATGRQRVLQVLALATAWSPVFPFGEAATPDTGLSPDTVRDWIADMVGRIAGQNPAAGSLEPDR